MGVDGQLRERGRPSQEDAADEETAPSGQVGNRIGEPGEEDPRHDDDSRNESKESKETVHWIYLVKMFARCAGPESLRYQGTLITMTRR